MVWMVCSKNTLGHGWIFAIGFERPQIYALPEFWSWKLSWHLFLNYLLEKNCLCCWQHTPSVGFLWNYIATKRQRKRQNLVRNVIISGQCIIRGIYLMHVKGVFKTFSYNEIMEPDNESITTPKNYLGTLSSLQKLRMTCSYYKIDCKWFNSRALL